MVIGNGMIAKSFNKYVADQNVLIFASGVSNSGSQQPTDYEREELLLRKSVEVHPEKTVVYFSTCSIYDPSLQASIYVQHKLKMEHILKGSASSFIIFRVSNPVGFTDNQHTVLNYFVKHIKEQEAFTVWQNAGRNLLDIEHVFLLCDHIIQSGAHKNSIVNIANPKNYPVTEIIKAIEKYFCVKGNYSLAQKGNSPLIDTAVIQPLFHLLGIKFNDHYLEALLQKYFPLS